MTFPAFAPVFVPPVPPPTIASIVPSQGTYTANTVFRIQGQDFQDTPTVTIQGISAYQVFFGDETELVVTVNSGGVAGPGDVVVTNPDTQSATVVGGFFLTDSPTLSAISPASGFSTGNSQITLTGTNFFLSASVLIGGYSCTDVVIVNATTITALTPPTPAAIYDVTVTTSVTFVNYAILAASYTVTDPPLL